MENIIKQTFKHQHGQVCEESTISFSGLQGWTANLHQICAATPELIKRAEEISEMLGIPCLDHDDQDRWSIDIEWEDKGAYLSARVTRHHRDAAVICTRNLISAITRQQPLDGDWQGDVIEAAYYSDPGSIRVYGQMAEVGDVLFFCEHESGTDHAMRCLSELLHDIDMDSSVS